VVRNYNWRIEYQCPQCGAPIFLEETDRLLSCNYCRVRLLGVFDGYSSYYLPPRTAQLKDIIFIPYWRFKGTAYSCEPGGVSHRIVDTTRCAAALAGAPYSLGLRPQVLTLKPVMPATVGRFLKIDLELEKVVDRVKERTLPDVEDFGLRLSVPEVKKEKSENNGAAMHDDEFVPYTEFVGDVSSLIYSPTLVRGQTLYDAVSKQPLAALSGESAEIVDSTGPADKKGIKFIPALCPRCGWDLEVAQNSVVAVCNNCNSAWQSMTSGMISVDFEIVPGEGESLLYLPFWKIKPEVTGVKLDNYADLAKLANVPWLPQDSWAELDFNFWVPAFHLPPPLFSKFSKRMTLMQKKKEPIKDLKDVRLHPASLSVHAVTAWLKVALFDMAAAKPKLLGRIGEVGVKVRSFILSYIPFQRYGDELIESSAKLRVSETALNRCF
jgi:DNA-directed RNA polymerase subunit RPC12/RpoP